jgi:hypothetical protein
MKHEKNRAMETMELASRSMIYVAITVVAAVVSACCCGCQGKREARMPLVDPMPAVQGDNDHSSRTFVHVRSGASVTYPSGWESKTIDSFVLMLVPARSPSRSAGEASTLLWGEHFISLDVPDLPAFRIPGFLPMGRIRSGYVDHLRKQMPHATTVFLEPPSILDAEASLVRTTWPGDHPTHVETALILTHADRVYIIRARSPVEDALATQTAFNQVVKSIRWAGEITDRGTLATATAGQAHR